MSNAFFFPCSLQFYDICAHFNKQDTVIWRKTSDIKNGDIVYIYISKPFYEVRYKCIVISDTVDEGVLGINKYAIPKGKISCKCRYIQLKLLRRFPPKAITLVELKASGVGQFMVPMHLPQEAYNLLLKKESEASQTNSGGDTDGD